MQDRLMHCQPTHNGCQYQQQRSRQQNKVSQKSRHQPTSAYHQLSTEHENIPTEGTFAPYSVQSLTSLEVPATGMTFPQTASLNTLPQTTTKSPNHNTRQTTAVQSRQSSIHMPLPPTSNSNFATAGAVQRLNEQNCAQQRKKNLKNNTQIMRRQRSRGEQDLNALQHQPNMKNKSSDSIQRYAKIQKFAKNQSVGGAAGADHLVYDKPLAERTMPREPKWLDMPLSTDGTSNRTHRSFFIVSGNEMQRSQPINQPGQSMQSRRASGPTGHQPKLHSTMGAMNTNRINESHLVGASTTEQNQFTSISDIPATMGDQRSTTPYLGNFQEQEQTQPDGKQEFVSTHQLLMMTASSINPMSNDAESQKMTARSPHDQIQKTSRHISRSGDHSATCITRLHSRDPNENGTKANLLYREAQTKSTNEFRRKLGNLKEALSTIKTNLSSFKQSASTSNLGAAPPSSRGGYDSYPAQCNGGQGVVGHTRNLAFSSSNAMPLAQQQHYLPTQQSCCTARQEAHCHTAGHQMRPSQQSCFCPAAQFSSNAADQQRSRSHPNLMLSTDPNQCRSNGSCSANSRMGNLLSKSNSCVVSPPPLHTNPTPCNLSLSKHEGKPSQALNFSDINHTADVAQSTVLKAPRLVDDSFAKTQNNNTSRNMEPLESSKTHRQCHEEATGEFVNLNPTEESSRRKEIVAAAVAGLSQNAHLIEPPMNPQHIQSEQSGETIEDVHRRHQNSLLLEEYSKRRKQQVQQQSFDNMMRKNQSSFEIVKPLDLEKFDDTKSMPHFSTVENVPLTRNNYNTIEQSSAEQIDRRMENLSKNASCKHQTVLSESKCHCCHNKQTLIAETHANRSQSTPPLSQMTYTQKENNQGERHERRVTEDHQSTMIVHDTIQLHNEYNPHNQQHQLQQQLQIQPYHSHSRLMPKSITSSVGQTLVSPANLAYEDQPYHQEPESRQLNRNSSKDQHPPAPNYWQQNHHMSRSVSSPIIIPARVTNRENNSCNIDDEALQVYHVGNPIPQLAIEQQLTRETEDRGLESRQDDKGSECALRRNANQINERQPGKIMRADKKQQVSGSNPNARQSRDQTRQESVNVDHDTYNQMRELKKQLELMKAEPPQQQVQEPPVEVRSKDQKYRQLKQDFTEYKRMYTELEYKLQLSIKENVILKQKCDSQLSSLARKDQLARDLETQVVSLREKAREHKEVIKSESQGFKTEISQLQDLLKSAEQEKFQLQYDARKKMQNQAPQDDERIETRFLTELLKMIGADKDQSNFEHVLKKLKKQQVFVKKLLKFVSQVEGRKCDSMNDCLKWVKGLLNDFVTLRRQVSKHTSLLKNLERPLRQFRSGKVEEEQSQIHFEEGCLSPIGQNSHFSGANIDSSGFFKAHIESRNGRTKENFTRSSSFSPSNHNQERSRYVNQFQTATNASMMNLSNTNIQRSTSGNRQAQDPSSQGRGPSHESQLYHLQGRGHSHESQRPVQPRASYTSQQQHQMANLDLNYPKYRYQNNVQDESVYTGIPTTENHSTDMHIKITSGSQNARKPSYHSSGGWTARRPDNASAKNKQGSSATGERKGSKRVSERSRSTRRHKDPTNTIEPAPQATSFNEGGRQSVPNILSSQGFPTDDSNECSHRPHMEHLISSSTNEPHSRRHQKRQQTRQKKQPCQNSHITSQSQDHTTTTYYRRKTTIQAQPKKRSIVQ